jgi:hypothetical protein
VRRPPKGIVIVAALMIVFGGAEAVTGFTHSFFGLSTAKGAVSTYAGAAMGALYALAGLLLLTMKRRAAALAIVLLMLVIIGRVAMAVTGLYSLDSFKQTFALILGTSMVAVFAGYVISKRSIFS